MKTDERGSIIVLTALTIVGIVGFMALGLDLGMMLVQKAVIARAADAAALAGVQELPFDTWAAQAKTLDYSERNGLVESEVTITVANSNRDIIVEATRNVALFFASVIGINSLPVTAKAQAHISTLTGVRGVAPLGVYEQDFVYGQQYMLKSGSQPGDGVYKGNFGPLALGGMGASTYSANLRNGFASMLRVGDTVMTETGDMAGPTADGITYRINTGVGCSFERPSWSCSRVVVVPVISAYISGGRTTVTVVGFAALYVEATTRNGSDNYVVGRFLQMVTEGEGGDTEYYGLRTSRLVE